MRIKTKDIVITSDFREEREGIGGLALDIKTHGLLQPITLKPLSDNRYDVIAGRRRFTALTEYLRLEELEEGKHFVLREEVDSLIAQLIENTSRKDFKPLERARLVWTIHNRKVEEVGTAVKGQEGGWSIKDTAKLIGLSPSSVAQYCKMWENKDLVEEDLSVSEAIEKIRCARATNMLKRVRKAIKDKVKTKVEDLSEHTKTCLNGFSCENALDFVKTLDAVDHIITDPPYGINLDKILPGDKEYKVYEDNEDVYWFLVDELIPEWRRLVTNGFVVVWCAFKNFDKLREKMSSAGFSCANSPIFWVKTKAGGTSLKPDKLLGNIVECALYAWSGDPKLKNQGRVNVFTFPKVNEGRVHVAQKPDELCVELLKTFTVKGDIVLDCFAGSGSMLRACIKTGRVFKGCEINEDFYNAAVSETSKLL